MTQSSDFAITGIKRKGHRLITRRVLSDTTFVLRIERSELSFVAGQHIHVGLSGSSDLREYSIYSGVDDAYLEILVREIDDGFVSKQLRIVRIGVDLRIEGPYGYFTIEEHEPGAKLLFVATGTGIAPFRSLTKTYPDRDYLLLHGTRFESDTFEYDSFLPTRIARCFSRGGPATGNESRRSTFPGRVTDYLREHPPSPGTKCYLCGNCDMIYEAFDILRGCGFESKDLYSEVYF